MLAQLSKSKVGALALLSLALLSVGQPARANKGEFRGASKCSISTPSGGAINVRESPNGRLVNSLRNGREVYTLRTNHNKRWAYVGGYYQGYARDWGWVFSDYLNCESPKPVKSKTVGGNGGGNFHEVSSRGTLQGSKIKINAYNRLDGLNFWQICPVSSSGCTSLNHIGGTGGNTFDLNIGDRCIVAISGHYDTATHKRKTASIYSIKFHFSDGSSSPTYGNKQRDARYPYYLEAGSGNEIEGFYGGEGAEVDRIGIITGPSNCNS